MLIIIIIIRKKHAVLQPQTLPPRLHPSFLVVITCNGGMEQEQLNGIRRNFRK